MSTARRPGTGLSFILTGLLALGLTAAAPARAQDSDPNDPSDVQTRLRRLEARVAEQDQIIARQSAELAQVRGVESDHWLTEQRAEQVKQLIRDVLADAETRAALVDDGLLAGYDHGFFLRSADGNFLLKISGMLQTRYYYSIQDQTAAADGDDETGGFDVRSRLYFNGHIIDPSWQYVLLAYFKPDGDATALDAYVLKQLDEQWAVTVGQFKLPFMYEYLVSQTRQQFVERSMITGELCGTYTQGLMVTYAADDWRAHGSVNDGTSSTNSDAFDDEAEVGLTTRLEVKLFGDWGQYNDWESWRNESPMAVVAAAVHYQQGERGGVDDESDILRWTADASWELGGANLFAAVVGNHLANGEDLDQLAVILQGGYFLTDKLELIARYEWGDSDVAGESDLNVVTAGWNYFFAGHALKWTTDFGWAFDAVSATWASDSLGWRTDDPAGDGQFVARSALQMLF